MPSNTWAEKSRFPIGDKKIGLSFTVEKKSLQSQLCRSSNRIHASRRKNSLSTDGMRGSHFSIGFCLKPPASLSTPLNTLNTQKSYHTAATQTPLRCWVDCFAVCCCRCCCSTAAVAAADSAGPPRTREQDTNKFSNFRRLQNSKEHKTYTFDPTSNTSNDKEGIQTHPVEFVVDRKPIFRYFQSDGIGIRITERTRYLLIAFFYKLAS